MGQEKKRTVESEACHLSAFRMYKNLQDGFMWPLVIDMLITYDNKEGKDMASLGRKVVNIPNRRLISLFNNLFSHSHTYYKVH